MRTTITNSTLTVQIKHLGAELCSLKNTLNTEYIWEANPDFWGKHSPVLFPIVGTLKNNSFDFDGKKYHLSRHGFARDMQFELIDENEDSATFALQASDNTMKNYPFNFELQIKYSLKDSRLFINYKVVNRSSSKMPFSIGAHPAFALPGNFEDYAIEFEKEEFLKYYLLENDLISNKTKTLDLSNKQLTLNYPLFENDALIFKTLESNSVTILENSKPKFRVYLKDFPSLGIWTKMNAPFICIEPWFGYSDTKESSGNILEKGGIQILGGHETFRSEFSIEIL